MAEGYKLPRKFCAACGHEVPHTVPPDKEKIGKFPKWRMSDRICVSNAGVGGDCPCSCEDQNFLWKP